MSTAFYLNWLLRQQFLAVLCDFFIRHLSFVVVFSCFMENFFYCFGPIICYGRSFTELLIHYCIVIVIVFVLMLYNIDDCNQMLEQLR